MFAGTSPDGSLVEIVEMPDHPWFVAVQFHPEFKSKPTGRIRCSPASSAPRSSGMRRRPNAAKKPSRPRDPSKVSQTRVRSRQEFKVTMSEEETSKPEIIIDDDWKSRAQAEKEQLQKEAEAKRKQQPSGIGTPDRADARHQRNPHAEADVPLPPASFSFLVTSLATQALAAMGQIPGADGKPVVQLEHAKHFIDTLGVLDEKTKGNLTPDEAAMLTNVLHELRLLFVAVGKQSAAATKES